MSKPSSDISNGILQQNPALVQLLGLCPLLAVSNTLVNALGLGIATLLTVVLTNTTVSLLRPLLRYEIRIGVFVLVIAGMVTVVDLCMEAWLFELHQSLGIFIPLIVTNCLILARAEACASRTTVALAARDGIAMGSGFCLALILLGALRELLTYGSLLRNAEQLFAPLAGDNAQNWGIQLTSEQYHFLLFGLPPGAFICLGLLVAAHKTLLHRFEQSPPPLTVTPIANQPDN